MSDWGLAEDLIQDTMARLVQAGPELSEGALVGYAVASARNSVISYHRRRQRRERLKPKVVDPDVPVDPEAPRCWRRSDRRSASPWPSSM